MRAFAARQRTTASAQRGVSLIELMISITVGLMILAALLMIVANTSRARAELERTSEKLENGRYAVEALSDDIQLAGFYGELKPNATAALPLPDPCALDPATWQAAMAFPVQGFTQGSVPACIPASQVAGTDVLSLRRTRTCNAGAPDCEPVKPSEPYFQVSFCSSANEKYALAIAGDASLSLKGKDCASAAPLRRYVVNTYFVSSDNGVGRQVPTLKRLEFSGAGFIETPVVEGVEQMKFVYGIDTDNDGSADGFTPDPASFTYPGCATCTADANWANVMSVRMTLLVRSLDPSPGYVDRKTYDLGATAAGAQTIVGPFNDGYHRRIYTGVVRLVNPSSRREQP